MQHCLITPSDSDTSGVFSPNIRKVAESADVAATVPMSKLARIREKSLFSFPVIGSTHYSLSQTLKRVSKICSTFISVAIKLPSYLQWLWLITEDISDRDM